MKPSPLTCNDIKTIIDQLSMDVREDLKQQVIHHPRALDVNGITGGTFLTQILSNILQHANILNFDQILLNSILSPTIVFPKSEFGHNLDFSWNCLVELFTESS
jgi:hypothetical protein